jgi:hypothetical protein
MPKTKMARTTTVDSFNKRIFNRKQTNIHLQCCLVLADVRRTEGVRDESIEAYDAGVI